MFRQQNVTARDLDLLCASLDNDLTAEEQVEFKKRLAESPQLNTLLAEQKQLKRALADLPLRHSPQNFTLTRAEAEKAKRGKFLQPVFGWASTISALLVAVIFGSQFIFQNVSLTAPAAPEGASQLEDAPMLAMENNEASIKTMASEPVFLLTWDYGFYGRGGAGGIGSGESISDSGGVRIDIYVNPNDFYIEEAAVESAATGEAVEDDPLELLMEAPQVESDSEIEATPKVPVSPTPLTRGQQTPKIYGVDPEKLGTILEVKPDSSPPEPQGQVRETAQPVDEAETDRAVLTRIGIGLLAASVVFGLIWWYLKFKL